jgi:hypothetical protein
MSELALARYTFRTARVVVPDAKSRKQGAAFRGIREAYALTHLDVVDGWRISVPELFELEEGLRRFPAASDFKAATDQMWLWANQKHRRKEVEDGWP